MNMSDSSSDTAGLTARVRTYWNERIHDLEMTTQPLGTRAFFEELDDYRFDKLAYLPQVIDFGGYKGKRLVEVGCGVGTDLVRFARGARVLGVDLSETAVTLARRNLAVHDERVAVIVADGSAAAPRRQPRRCLRPRSAAVRRRPSPHRRGGAARVGTLEARPSSWSTTVCRGCTRCRS